ncbi:MAG: tRNA preQ1(34) S-adenosylmethionine ribosyltransferase-isomerase QueA [Gammaproteobacteria bacterium]|jgi:S-adenosylmethionine:tRNA ribosyltransferase-isomerase
MKLADFYYKLPLELIARYPTKQRSASRLLCLNCDTGEIQHRHFGDLINLLTPKDLLVFNNSRVIPARLYGTKDTGGQVELLIERILDKFICLAHIKASRAPKPGSRLKLENAVTVKVLSRHDDLFKLEFPAAHPIMKALTSFGRIPLPPYIDRAAEAIDQERYQTVYAKHNGSVAAPTAGLHFDEELLKKIENKGIKSAFVTLHVGAGTFQPVKTDDIRQHKMHSELIQVTEEVCQQIQQTKQSGGCIIAVGTTSVRCLETATQSGKIKPYFGETDIFIYPGYKFKCVDAMITNFHLPESTLLMLVSAFAGHKNIMLAYQEAIAKKYRFFSYGDAMFIF